MKTSRVLLLSAALLLVAACGTKGDLYLSEANADAAKAGTAQPTGGVSRPLPDEDGDTDNTGAPLPNADGETPDEAADDE
jgi:predicted small lipoprotein YifL